MPVSRHAGALALVLAVLVALVGAAGARAAAPVAVVSGPAEARTGEGVGFDGSGSTDPDGGRLAYGWTIDGQDVHVAHDWLAVSFAYGGAHVVALTVTDAAGETAVAKHTIRVTGPDRPVTLPGLSLPRSLSGVLSAEPRLDLRAPRARVRLRGGKLRVEVRCRGAGRCTGVMKASARLRRGGDRVVLGRRAFTVRRGRTVVHVPVRRAVRASLRRHERLRVQMTAFRSRFPLAGVWDTVRFRLRR